jgi:phosphoglycolate phosphatase
MRPASVTFDLDGTLLDTATDLHVSANRMLAELGRPLRTEAEIRRFVGTGGDAQAGADRERKGISGQSL